ncbi:MAG: radical SAM protein [Dehalococcoidales bacterium]
MSRDKYSKGEDLVRKEQGTIVKNWGGRLPVGLIYPNSYYIGMSNLGMQFLYRMLNAYGDVVCERIFYEEGMLYSLENLREINEFPVLAFTVSYELDYFNVIDLIKQSAISLYAEERNANDPIIIAGGPCIISNPVPLAPFLDCMCIGEAEALMPSMLPVLADVNLTRDQKLEALSNLPGLYVPQFYTGKKIIRQYLSELEDIPVTAVLTTETELGNLYLIEAERGCNWGCRFCMVGKAFSPIRFHSAESIIKQAKEGVEFRDRIGLVGAVVSDHPQIEEIIAAIRGLGAGISISSMRIKPLYESVLKAIVESGAQTLTLAPEAGSQRLRDVINKRISEDDIIQAVEKVTEYPLKTLKFYFMIGLPSETDEDVQEIVTLVLKCKDILVKKLAGCRIDINVAQFIPKAGTPFQWMPMADEKILNRRLTFLKKKLIPLGVQVKNESTAWSLVQAVLSRGDSKIAELLAAVESVTLSEWKRKAKELEIDLDYYTVREWDTAEKLPWGFIDCGTDKDKLQTEFERATLF